MSKFIAVNPENFDVSKISLDGKYINYDNHQLMIQTTWVKIDPLNGSIRLYLKENNALISILKHIDNIVASECEEMKPIKILKTWHVFGSDEALEYIDPKFQYSIIYDIDKKEIKMDDFLKLIEKEKYECRCILAFSPMKIYKQYYGASIKCIQMQIRPVPRKILNCLFE